MSELLHARTEGPDRPLMAYVGTFSSPLGDVLPTQVDLPPGNGRGIHILRVDRATGAAKLLDFRTPPTELAPNNPSSDPSGPRSVPEPNALVALAFAGVVILARHRFRP